MTVQSPQGCLLPSSASSCSHSLRGGGKVGEGNVWHWWYHTGGVWWLSIHTHLYISLGSALQNLRKQTLMWQPCKQQTMASIYFLNLLISRLILPKSLIYSTPAHMRTTTVRSSGSMWEPLPYGQDHKGYFSDQALRFWSGLQGVWDYRVPSHTVGTHA